MRLKCRFHFFPISTIISKILPCRGVQGAAGAVLWSIGAVGLNEHKLPSSNSSDWLCWSEQGTNKAMKLLQIDRGPRTSSGSAKAWVTLCCVFCDFGFVREVVGMEDGRVLLCLIRGSIRTLARLWLNNNHREEKHACEAIGESYDWRCWVNKKTMQILAAFLRHSGRANAHQE